MSSLWRAKYINEGSPYPCSGLPISPYLSNIKNSSGSILPDSLQDSTNEIIACVCNAWAVIIVNLGLHRPQTSPQRCPSQMNHITVCWPRSWSRRVLLYHISSYLCSLSIIIFTTSCTMWDISGYAANAIRTLKPTWHPVANPISLLSTLNRKQWTFFMVGITGYDKMKNQ